MAPIVKLKNQALSKPSQMPQPLLADKAQALVQMGTENLTTERIAELTETFETSRHLAKLVAKGGALPEVYERGYAVSQRKSAAPAPITEGW